MKKLEEIIIEKIKKEGPLSFENFMDMALYYPGLGYYASSDRLIGKAGDFYTSSHLHPLFGAMIARQLFEMWEVMDRPQTFHAVEMGAGAGYLCKDILEYLHTTSEDMATFTQSLNYVLVEPYAHFEKKQHEVMHDISKKISSSSYSGSGTRQIVSWVTSLDELDNLKGCLLSNELLDAFPVHIAHYDRSVQEIYVGFNGTGFKEERGTNSPNDLTDYMQEFNIQLQDGYRTEINLRIKDWLRKVSEKLIEGFLLTVDYGYTAREYYDESRSSGTLLCYHEHKYNAEPLKRVGEQDITAHVNFSSLKKWGDNLGFNTVGYCPQGTYLISSGIDEVISELYGNTPDYDDHISRIKGLIMPQGMGESHNVIIQYTGNAQPSLRGFTMRNNAGLL
jgi:SAM-dependent MidA family methyltransferase